MSKINLPAGYEPINGALYPTKEKQREAYEDIKVYTDGSRTSFLYGKKRAEEKKPVKLAWPIDKIFITQYFGGNKHIYKQFGLAGHNGLDFRVRFIDSPLGRRYVTASLDGICEVRNQGKAGYGLHVRITHQDGSKTIYGHLTKAYVKTGQKVATGERIGLTGSTGFSTGPHLHMEYRPAGEPSTNGYAGAVDPLPFLPPIK